MQQMALVHFMQFPGQLEQNVLFHVHHLNTPINGSRKPISSRVFASVRQERMREGVCVSVVPGSNQRYETIHTRGDGLHQQIKKQ